MPDLREKRVDLILQQLEELPTLPAVAIRVLEVTRSDGSTADQVVELISSDPALTARILQLVNNAASGVRGEIESVQRAVVLLGFEAVRSAVLAVSVFQTFGAVSVSPGGHFSREEFWKHCVAVASCAELLAEHLKVHGTQARGVEVRIRVAPGDAFICGLLHDLGKVALDAVLPKSFGRVVEACDLLRGNIADIEQTVIGLDHMVVGKRLCEKWNLPAVIRDCVWLHGQDPGALPSSVKNPGLVNLITLADQIVREQHLGYSGNYTFNLPRKVLLEATGLSAEAVKTAAANLLERIEPRAKSLGLDRSSTTELFQQAVAQANKELGRMSGQLESKNRRLTVRAQFFEALSKFQSELRPDVSPQIVLQAIAQTAVNVLGVKVAAAFSLPPDQHYAETLLCDEQGLIFENSLIDLAKSKARPPTPRAGEGPVMSAGDELDWLITMISPRLAGDKRFWVCLEADGHCVGGVVWGADAGEAARLSPQAQELLTIANGWALALRTSQIREEARATAEQLAETNRRLQDAQSEILRSRTMIAVGEMAAGAAHEMNNPLAVISGRSQLLAQQLDDPKFKAAAHLIHEQSHRLSEIITELMDFAKPEAAVIDHAEIAEVIDRALHEAKSNNDPADRKIELTMGDVPLVAVDARQVSAAVTEVIENAIHATDPSTGDIQIHGGYDPYSSRVVVTVTDNGCGMDENTVKRAFDPFFSAKPAGRRRGLGLAKALRWIEASGGLIRLESRPGQGTRTLILLPAVANNGTGAAAVAEDGRKSRVV
ncbi:MAG TPA: HDOD domain-containing protein [Tepidisphaeraceae bacterium]|nr:HDOD domain-containing protein [Tepidisphaeraceae bacterium]